jgi:hypothetical protein
MYALNAGDIGITCTDMYIHREGTTQYLVDWDSLQDKVFASPRRPNDWYYVTAIHSLLWGILIKRNYNRCVLCVHTYQCRFDLMQSKANGIWATMKENCWRSESTVSDLPKTVSTRTSRYLKQKVKNKPWTEHNNCENMKTVYPLDTFRFDFQLETSHGRRPNANQALSSLETQTIIINWYQYRP